MSKMLARRQQLWNGANPSTQGGVGQVGQSPPQQEDASATAFYEETAKLTGKSARTVRRKTQIGQDICDEAAQELAGSEVANNQAELEKLSKLSATKQVAIAKEIKNGARKRVPGRRARGTKCDPCDRGRIQERGLKGIRSAEIALDLLGMFEHCKESIEFLRDALNGNAPWNRKSQPDESCF